MNGTFALSGSIPLTYTGGSFRNAYGGCGTNNCHNSGKNAAPQDSSLCVGHGDHELHGVSRQRRGLADHAVA